MDSEEGTVPVYSGLLPYTFLVGDDLKDGLATILMYTQVNLLNLLAL